MLSIISIIHTYPRVMYTTPTKRNPVIMENGILITGSCM